MERLGQSIGFSWERALEGVNKARVHKGGDSSATVQCKAAVRHCKSSPEDIYTHKENVNLLEQVQRRP